MLPLDERKMTMLCLALEVEPTQTNRRQLLRLMQAYEKFIERNKVHRDLWAKHDVLDALHHMQHKMSRVENAITDQPGITEDDREAQSVEAKDDALDLINYTAFLVRHLLD